MNYTSGIDMKENDKAVALSTKKNVDIFI